MKRFLTVTIGIPTYYGGPALVKAAESILCSQNVGKFRLIVTVDGNPLEKNIHNQLAALGVEVIDNKERGGQLTRIKQIISLTKTDILILTQDDIQFAPDAICKTLRTFSENQSVTMIGARVLPVPAKTRFEAIVEVGVRLTHRMGDLWNNGDNYLLASGRCLAFRTQTVKKFVIPDTIINSDAYLYFENKRLGGVFKSLSTAKVFNKSPQTLKEHLKQSRKFQYSREELSNSTHYDLKSEYSKPKLVSIRAYAEEFVQHPLLTLLYLCVFIYTRTQQKNMYAKAKRFWETDVSTKKV